MQNVTYLFRLGISFAIYTISFQYKLCRVRKTSTGPKNVPFIVTHDGRTIRYPDPLVKVNDTVMVDIASGKMKDYIKFDTGGCNIRSMDF